jgi:translation initiation factor 1
MKKNDWKKREGVVYSTNENFSFNVRQDEEPETLKPSAQVLRVRLDTSGRAGKQVTLITGFVGKHEDLEELGRQLKAHCGTGGSAKEGEILIQGDQREKVKAYLQKKSYRCG